MGSRGRWPTRPAKPPESSTPSVLFRPGGAAETCAVELIPVAPRTGLTAVAPSIDMGDLRHAVIGRSRKTKENTRTTRRCIVCASHFQATTYHHHHPPDPPRASTRARLHSIDRDSYLDQRASLSETGSTARAVMNQEESGINRVIVVLALMLGVPLLEGPSKSVAQPCFAPGPCGGGPACVPVPTSLVPVSTTVVPSGGWRSAGGNCGIRRCWITLLCPCGSPLASEACP